MPTFVPVQDIQLTPWFLSLKETANGYYTNLEAGWESSGDRETVQEIYKGEIKADKDQTRP